MEEQLDTKAEEVEELTEDEVLDLGDSSRRSFMKKGALATGALALGTAGANTASAQQTRRVLVFAYQYYPNIRFRVRQPLQASTTVNILRRPDGNRVPEISQPDDYNGYVIDYRLQDNARVAGITTLLFTRGLLERGVSYRLAADAQVFTSELNLLSTTARRVGN